MDSQLYIDIRGRVQGVYFRAHTQEQARALGLVGWVRNHADGSVQVLARGPRAALEALAAWCWRGSPWSHVDDVRLEWVQPDLETEKFFVERTFIAE